MIIISVGAVGLFVFGVLAAALRKLLSDEIAGYLPVLTAQIIRRQVRGLPAEWRERYEQEWFAEASTYSERRLRGLIFALGLKRAAKGLAGIHADLNQALFDADADAARAELRRVGDPDRVISEIARIIRSTAPPTIPLGELFESMETINVEVERDLDRIVIDFDANVRAWRKRSLPEVLGRPLRSLELAPDAPAELLAQCQRALTSAWFSGARAAAGSCAATAPDHPGPRRGVGERSPVVHAPDEAQAAHFGARFG